MTEEIKQAQATKQPVKQATKVQTVYGRMVHVVTGQVFDGEVEADVSDPWVKAQVEAGKLKVVK